MPIMPNNSLPEKIATMTILLGIHINTTIYIEYICNRPLILSTSPISKNIR